MRHMNDEQIHDWILDQLSNGRRKDDIVKELAEKTGRHWGDLEQLVLQVSHEKAITIRRRQSPWVAGLALVTFLGGVGLLAVTGFIIYKVVEFYRTTQPEVFSMINIFFLVFNEAPTAIWLGSLGLAMMLGSMRGMQKVWEDWLAG